MGANALFARGEIPTWWRGLGVDCKDWGCVYARAQELWSCIYEASQSQQRRQMGRPASSTTKASTNPPRRDNVNRCPCSASWGCAHTHASIQCLGSVLGLELGKCVGAKLKRQGKNGELRSVHGHSTSHSCEKQGGEETVANELQTQ